MLLAAKSPAQSLRRFTEAIRWTFTGTASQTQTDQADRGELSGLLSLIDYLRDRLSVAIRQLPSDSLDRDRLLEEVQRLCAGLSEDTKAVRRWTE